MKLKNLLLGITLFLFAGLASADNCLMGPCEKADLPTCGAKLKGREFVVKNCVSASSCATTASPGFAVTQVCDYTGSAWAYRNSDATAAPDLSPYALLAGDADGQTIQGVAGADMPRINISSTELNLYGDGAGTPAPLSIEDGEIWLTSQDQGSHVAVYDGTAEIGSDGSLKLSGLTVNINSAQTPPTNANDTCSLGDTIDTATFHYYCAATNTWVRVAMATWP